ncbi:hypothetical protein MJO29_004679 [Puccinia striiformis f. sp. tritici]|nr:hypothetical protein MJO29_004679 [Puccinia striiformis f. sp. tritici]
MFDSTTKPSAARLPVLVAPGPESNYLNWEAVLWSYFEALEITYVLEDIKPKLRPDSWLRDSRTVCTILLQCVSDANVTNIRQFRGNAHKMWKTLKDTHLDYSTGGQMFWMRKLVKSEFTEGDIESHLDKLADYADRLSALVTDKNPLTPDDVHAAALLVSLPDSWVQCLSGFINQEGVTANRIATALRQELLRQKARLEGNVTSVASTNANSNSSGSTNKNRKHQSSTDNNAGNTNRYCPLCNVNSHDLNHCNNTRQLIRDHKANQKSHEKVICRAASN